MNDFFNVDYIMIIIKIYLNIEITNSALFSEFLPY